MGFLFNGVKKFFSSSANSAQICLGRNHFFFVDYPYDHLKKAILNEKNNPPYVLKYKIDFSIPDDVNIEELKHCILRDFKYYFPRKLLKNISVSFSDDLTAYEVKFSYDP